MGIVNMMRGAFIFLVFIWKPSIWRATKATHPRLAAAIAKGARHLLPREGRKRGRSVIKQEVYCFAKHYPEAKISCNLEEIPFTHTYSRASEMKNRTGAASRGFMKQSASVVQQGKEQL